MIYNGSDIPNVSLASNEMTGSVDHAQCVDYINNPIASASHQYLFDAGVLVVTKGFSEQGNTGFELQAQASSAKRTQAGVGVRLHSEEPVRQGWYFDASLAWMHSLSAPDTGFTAEYAGFDDAPFRIDGMATARDAGWLGLGAQYRSGHQGNTIWFLRADARGDRNGVQQGWSAGVRRDF